LERALLGNPKKVATYHPSPPRQGQKVRYSIDDSKFKSFGWSPKENFDEKIEEIITYYKNNFIW
jgi:dTDP-D-glucose 4,6-dehydratase